MSYDISVVIPPIPDDDAKAWATIEQLSESDGPPPDAFRSLHDRLTAHFPCVSSLPEGQEGVWSCVPLWDVFGSRVGSLSIRFSEVDRVLPVLFEAANELGLPVFDPQKNKVYRADGVLHLRLTLENQSPLPGPTLSQLEAAVDSLTPNGGPAFLIVEGVAEDYVQAAGGNGDYTAEWREYSGAQFRHWVAGYPTSSSGEMINILTNGAYLLVQENEKLESLDVKAILTAYAQGTGRPGHLEWRDITDRFR